MCPPAGAHGMRSGLRFLNDFCPSDDCTHLTRTARRKTQDAAASACVPRESTSSTACEWSLAVDGATLHENVIFAGDTVPDVPFDSITCDPAPALWNELEAGCEQVDGCRATTIARRRTPNSNARAAPGHAGTPGRLACAIATPSARHHGERPTAPARAPAGG